MSIRMFCVFICSSKSFPTKCTFVLSFCTVYSALMIKQV